MHDIKINYGSGRHMRRSLPSSWEEVPRRERWGLLRDVIAGKTILEILIRMLDLPVIIRRNITKGEWYDLSLAMSWLHDQLPIDKPILQYISPRKTALYFPADNFTNVTGLEYALLDDMIIQGGQEDKILAVLCRPTAKGRPDYDKRILLTDSNQIEEWMPDIQAIPEEIKTYLHAVFSGYRIRLYETYKDWLFESTSDSTDDAPADTGGLNFGWWGAFLSIAQDGVFGTYDEVLQTPIHTICMHLVQEEEKVLKIQEQHDHAAALAKMQR